MSELNPRHIGITVDDLSRRYESFVSHKLCGFGAVPQKSRRLRNPRSLRYLADCSLRFAPQVRPQKPSTIHTLLLVTEPRRARQRPSGEGTPAMEYVALPAPLYCHRTREFPSKST